MSGGERPEPLLPPGVPTQVAAASCLVLAPHADDEVLGCGGLLAQLAREGAVVRVLFLSDGGGGGEEVTDRAAYRATRRAEAAAAAAVLGLAGVEHLDLADGALGLAREAMAAALRRALVTLRPELVLVPSPLEVSADHRAAFAALHDVLGPVRPDDGLAGEDGDRAALFAATRGLRVLAYEVNHPAYPDLLVDVSAEVPLLERAMACYASQEARHPYLAAALGLRRYRCLSLTPAATAAEAYRQLTPADFSTRSLAALVGHLGGVPALQVEQQGPTISVVVRTRDRPRLLAAALASLAASTWQRAEVVLVNDGGASPEVPADFPLPVRRVEHATSRGRAAAANAGIAVASGELIAFLDDDDLVFPEHLATLAFAAAWQDAGVVYSDAAVGVYELAGDGSWRCVERRLPYSRDFDPDRLLVDNYIPFNTVAIRRELLAAVGPLEESLEFFEDWDLLVRLSARTRFQHLRRTTCEYRHFRGAGHHVFGETPRGRADFLVTKARVLARHAERLTPELLARVVDGMRAEAVGYAEAAAERQAAWQALRGQHDAVQHTHRLLADDYHRLEGAQRELSDRYWEREEAFHQLNGEHASLLGEATRLSEDLRRLYGVERELREAASAQGELIAGLYAQNAVLDAAVHELEPVRGELAAVQAALAAATARDSARAAEVARLQGEEGRLAAAVAEQQASLGTLHAEIGRLTASQGELQTVLAATQAREGELWHEVERLNGLIRAMEATRAWRLHRFTERLRGGRT